QNAAGLLPCMSVGVYGPLLGRGLMPGKSSVDGAHALNFSWLLQLRWGAVLGQLGLILGVRFLLGIEIPLGPLSALLAVEALSNAAFAVHLRRSTVVQPWVPGLLMALDVVVLTAMLRLTG